MDLTNLFCHSFRTVHWGWSRSNGQTTSLRNHRAESSVRYGTHRCQRPASRTGCRHGDSRSLLATEKDLSKVWKVFIPPARGPIYWGLEHAKIVKRSIPVYTIKDEPRKLNIREKYLLVPSSRWSRTWQLSKTRLSLNSSSNKGVNLESCFLGKQR